MFVPQFNVLPDPSEESQNSDSDGKSKALANVLSDVPVNSPRAKTMGKTKQKGGAAFFIGAGKGDADAATQRPRDHPRIILRGFQAPTFVDFAEVSLADGKQTLELRLINDTEESVTVSKSNISGPTKDGFDVTFSSKRSKTTVDGNSEQTCVLSFEPSTFGAVRGQMVLKLSTRHRCTLIVAATVMDKNMPTQRRNVRASKGSGASSFRRVLVEKASKKPAPKQRVATRKKEAKKPNKTATSSKPSQPLARGKQLYDQNWDDKQEDGFTTWMNHILCTKQPLNNSAADESEASAKLSDGEHIFATLATKREEASIRKKALDFYQSSEVRDIQDGLERRISKGTITVRSDKHIGRDVGLRKTVFEILFAYEPAWLRLGLEIVFGEIVSFPPNASAGRKRSILKQFVVDRIINNAELKHKFKRTVKGTTSKEFTVAAGNYAMERIFMLVFFLDQAHLQRFIPHKIRLFRKTAKFKSSKKLLTTFAKEFLQVCLLCAAINRRWN